MGDATSLNGKQEACATVLYVLGERKDATC